MALSFFLVGISRFLFLLGQSQGTSSTVTPAVDNYRRMEAVGCAEQFIFSVSVLTGYDSQSSLNYHPRAIFSDTPSATVIESGFLSTSLSASFFTSNGQTQTTSIPVTLAFATLVPYLPSESADAAELPSASSNPTPTPKLSFPILPVAAGGGGLVVVVILGITALLLCRRRRRKAALHRRMMVKIQPNLDSELPRGELAGSRTFSRLTYSAPYVVPQSAGTLSTAAPIPTLDAWTAGYEHLNSAMAQTIIYILLFLAILVQRSACLSWAIEPSDTGSLASQSDASSASVPFSPGKGVSALPTIVPAPGASSVHISGYTDVGGQGSVYNFPQSTVLRPGPPDGGGSTSSELVLTGTRTFSASSQIFIGDTQTSTSASITVIVLPANPSTSDGVAISSPVSPITATTSSDALPIPSSISEYIVAKLAIPYINLRKRCTRIGDAVSQYKYLYGVNVLFYLHDKRTLDIHRNPHPQHLCDFRSGPHPHIYRGRIQIFWAQYEPRSRDRTRRSRDLPCARSSLHH
ncbi:hypothetical protein MVEN_01485100 [Mycena venus]|uniref:IPT/TIG domain-containing protein n=1 Tax=Mycena venus TaxID=2733690 RepID=A0A8H6XSK5_9AGAR|nr:hypothetical protein MVEN_01485100 [Mycena venus]